ncbi:MAG: winged helix-turn-helix transcriptional regulator [Vicinamibacterales bacterium]
MPPLAVSGPLRRLLDGLGNKWTAAVIDLLARRDARFSDLLADCHVTPKMLTRVLRDLEADGIVARGAWPGQTGHPRYRLTVAGHALHAHLKALEAWTEATGARPPAPASAPPAALGTTGAAAEPADEPGAFVWGHPRVHLALATATMEHTRRLLAGVLGTPVPGVSTTEIMREGVRYGLQVCAWRFENLVLELVASTDGLGPFAEYTRRRPAGVHHFSYYVGHSAEPRSRWLAQRADGVVWGHGTYAAFDFLSDLGVNISVADRAGIPANSWPVVEVPRSSPFFHVTHLGVLVHDLHRTLATYQGIFGGPAPRVRHYTPPFMPSARAGGEAAIHVATCEQPNVAVQYCEPSGESPLRRFLAAGGSGVYTLDFNVGDRLAEVTASLAALGGEPIIEGPKGDYVLVQMPPETGFSIGLWGRAAAKASRTVPSRRSA